MIYAFATGKTKLSNLLWGLNNVDACYIVYPNNIDHYLQMILHEKPTHVLGMGIYSGRDQDKIRIETMCTNKFKNDFVDKPERIEFTIPNFLTEDNNFKLARGMGNSYCNFSAYKITQFIASNKIETKFSFLHIPKSFNSSEILSMVDEKLKGFR